MPIEYQTNFSGLRKLRETETLIQWLRCDFETFSPQTSAAMISAEIKKSQDLRQFLRSLVGNWSTARLFMTRKLT